MRIIRLENDEFVKKYNELHENKIDQNWRRKIHIPYELGSYCPPNVPQGIGLLHIPEIEADDVYIVGEIQEYTGYDDVYAVFCNCGNIYGTYLQCDESHLYNDDDDWDDDDWDDDDE